MIKPDPVRVAFFGKSEEPLSLRGLEYLLRSDDYEIVSVTCGTKTGSTKGTGTLQTFARAHGLTMVDFPDVGDALDDADMIFSWSNSVVFPAEFFDKVPLGVVNMHPAALPYYRGSNGIMHAILNGEAQYGVTIHYCEVEIDTGAVIDLQYIPIHPDEPARSVWSRVDELAMDMLARLAPRLAEAGRRGEKVTATPQAAEHARWYSTSSVADEYELDLSLPEELQRRYVRAYDHPQRPKAYVVVGDRRVPLEVHDGRICIASPS